MLEKFAGDILVGPVFAGQFQRDRQHIEAIHAHPTGAVGLFDMAAGRQRGAAVEDADIVQAEKPALKDVLALGVFAIDPPGKIQQQLMKHALEKRRSPTPLRFFSIL